MSAQRLGKGGFLAQLLTGFVPFATLGRLFFPKDFKGNTEGGDVFVCRVGFREEARARRRAISFAGKVETINRRYLK